MDPEDWKTRWREGRIGFHEGRPNRFLTRHIPELRATKRVFVPLCGKAEDLAFLAESGKQVVGVDVSEMALRAFFAERGLVPEETRVGDLLRLSAGSVTLFSGDVFACTRDLLGPVDALYDRAALVALPRDIRRRYTQHVRSLLPKGALGLVVSFEYPEEEMEGPPFSVRESELRELFADCALELLGEDSVDFPRLVDSKSKAQERCFRITF